MTNPHDQLTALHTLATEWPGGIKWCPWWDDWVCLWQDGQWYYGDERCCANMKMQHALDIVTAEAERWLECRGFWLFTKDGRCYMGPGVAFDSLPEALKHAKDQDGTSPTHTTETRLP